METSSVNYTTTKKKILGTICLIIFSVAFIFACLKNVLPVGKLVIGTFGYMAYPMLIILSLISLAGILGMSYSRSGKATAYFAFTILAVLVFIQTLTTFKDLNKVVSWKSLEVYLKLSYNTKTTIIGAFGSLLCGFIAIPLGAMGAIVVSVISATLFGGLFIDYQFYGKYEPHVKKIKTRAVREKVHKSDKKKTKDGSPVYTFTGNNNEVVGEIIVDESELNSTQSIYEQPTPKYTNDDVLAEITDESIMQGSREIDDDYSDFAPETSFSTQQPTQQFNDFTNDIYQEPSYPGIGINDKDENRRQFIEATFGSSYAQQSVKPSESLFGGMSNNLDFANNEPEASVNDIFGGLDISENNDDELSQILNKSDDDFDIDLQTNDFNRTEQLKPIESAPTFIPKVEKIEPEPMPYNQIKSNPYEFNNKVQQQPQQNIFGNAQQNNFNSFGFNIPKPPEPVVVPPKQTQPFEPFRGSVQNGLPGLRYNAPPLNLLKPSKPDNGDYSAEQNRKSAQLEQVLEAFNVPAKVKNIVRGPKITRYELSVPLGVSVKKIPSYEDDIAAALAAKTIVIKAPIPGSSYVGIELENDTFTSVSQREILESDSFQNCKDPLPIAIGKDISGEIIVKSLAKMVHLLIAGSTGSGKSVFMHNIIMSLLYKSSPDDLKLVMIDPKKVEFNRYNGLPHLLTPEVVSGSDKAINAFKWCVKEMERRYTLMEKAGHNNIEPYNKSDLVKAGQFERLPYIVIIVDELAEIMAVNKKDVELCIQRLTQLARACGMHLIVATQRPSVDIITGVIKNNIPSRIAFSLQSGIDSKTIINTVGAEKLLGQGDMIFNPTGTSVMPRLQASYASDDEIKAVIDYIKKNNTANYDENINSIINAEEPETTDEVSGGNGGFIDAPPPKDLDSYFKTAVKIVMASGGASVSALQRRLSIGYSRAARIIDQMEEKGFIAPASGAKQRKILITPEQFREEFGEDYNSID